MRPPGQGSSGAASGSNPAAGGGPQMDQVMGDMLGSIGDISQLLSGQMA